jgi:predicted DNA-binding protein
MPSMRRTSILLDPGLLAELERIAHRQGRPTAHVIREALERYASQARKQHTTLPAFIALGQGADDGSSMAEDAPADDPAAAGDE